MFPLPISSIVLHVKRKKSFRRAGRLLKIPRLRQTKSSFILIIGLNNYLNPFFQDRFYLEPFVPGPILPDPFNRDRFYQDRHYLHPDQSIVDAAISQ